MREDLLHAPLLSPSDRCIKLQSWLNVVLSRLCLLAIGCVFIVATLIMSIDMFITEADPVDISSSIGLGELPLILLSVVVQNRRVSLGGG